jgi:hypothetical protein
MQAYFRFDPADGNLSAFRWQGLGIFWRLLR